MPQVTTRGLRMQVSIPMIAGLRSGSGQGLWWAMERMEGKERKERMEGTEGKEGR